MYNKKCSRKKTITRISEIIHSAIFAGPTMTHEWIIKILISFNLARYG